MRVTRRSLVPTPNTAVRSAALLGLVLHTGCYLSHTIPLEGERYACQCAWTQLVPTADIECDSDGCTFTPCASIDCFEEVHSIGSVRPCTTFETDPEYICAEACADPRFAPPLTTESEVLLAEYASAGWCSTLDDPPRTFFFPEVPADAVRHGRVVAELSSLRLSIAGVGTTEVIQPVDGTPVTIQGGTCDGSTPCALSINDAQIRVDGPVTFEGHTLDGLSLSTAEGMIASAQVVPAPSPPHSWRLLGDSTATSTMSWEFFGSVDGATQEGGLEWVQPLTAPEDGPGGDFDLRRGAPDPHMRFTGVLRDTLMLDDGSSLDVTIEADVFVRFFSGAPIPSMRAVDTGGAMEPLLLDGSASYDDLGAAIVDYLWLVRQPDGVETVIAHGVRAVLPPGAYASLPQGSELCLQVTDADGLYDKGCTALTPKPDPTVPPPDCFESGTTTVGGWRFGDLIELAGLRDWIATKNHITVLVPSDAAIAAAFGGGGPKDAAEAEQFVLTHVLEGRHAIADIRNGKVDLSKNYAGLAVAVAPKDVAEQATIPDVDCLDGEGVTHRVGLSLWSSK